jgi:mRNA degradation ribonuclease J1/J2
MLPKFLLADNSLETPDTIFVVHTETPRFIVEADIDDFWSNQHIHWIDGEPGDEELITEKEFENEDLLDEDEE